jgi:hypothetical protein
LYERAESLNRRTAGRIYNTVDRIAWLPGGQAFTYRKNVRGGFSFMLADVTTATKAAAFDHAKLAAALSSAAGAQYTAVTLPFAAFDFADNRRAIEFTTGDGGPQARWRCTLADYVCARQTGGAAPAAPGRLPRAIRPRAPAEAEVEAAEADRRTLNHVYRRTAGSRPRFRTSTSMCGRSPPARPEMDSC